MRPETLGRVLGTGLRVAGRVAGQRLSAAAEPASSSTASRTSANPASRTASQPAARIRPRGKTGGNLGRAFGGFFKPFRRVGGKLWLEVTGIFFLLPVVVFAPTLWRTRGSYVHGPDHRTFVASAIVVAVFFYLGVSSFWRARRK